MLAAEAALIAGSAGTTAALVPTNLGQAAHTLAHRAPQTPVDGPSEVADAGSARLQARLQQRKIEVLSERTADSTTYALPNGQLQTVTYASPIRVKRDGEWRDVNTALADSGPHLTPRSAAADIAVSDGGDTTLASVSKGAKSFGLGWEKKLPTPKVKNNTASYDLGSGQTLTVTALAQGFSQNVVLDHRPGGPVSYRIPLNLDGLKLSQAASGHLLLKDSAGKLVAEAPAPMMWDSSRNKVSGEPQRQARVATKIETADDGKQTLVLSPAAHFLAAATYPVTVDPTSTLAVTTDTWVQTPDYLDSQVSSTELKSGTYDGGADVARSYLKFDVTPYKGKHITDTNLALYSYYSSTCATTGAGTQVRRVTSDWSSSTVTWGTQPSTTTTDAKTNTAALGYSSSCPAGTMNFDIDAIVQAWANGSANYGLQVRGADETDTLTWRRFRSANYISGDNSVEPHLTVTYNSYGTTSSAAISPSVVNAYNGKRYVTSLTPALSAKVTDADGGNAQGQFEITPDPAYADTTYTYTAYGKSVASGSTSTLTIPSGSAFPAGVHLRYRVRAYDGTDYGSWSGYSAFVLNTGLPVAPTVTCATYGQNTWTPKASGSVTCTLDTTSTDGQGFYWGLDDPSTPKRVDDTTDGSGGDPLTVSISPADGWHTLYAKTVDSGGNLSTATTKYSFGVGADGAALLAPGDGDRPARRVALVATGKPTYTGVTYQYRRGETDAWHTVPLADVTRNADGSAVASWPLAATNGAPPALTWNITSSLAEDGPVDLRAAFTDGTITGYSPVSTVVVDRNAGTAPSQEVGPGQVNQLTGDYVLSAVDASGFGLTVGRMASSRRPTAAADAEGQAAIFGPQWTSGTMAEASDSLWLYVRKTSATSVAITDAHGVQTGFTATTANGWKAEPGAGDLTLTGSLSGSFTLKETDGTTTTFAKVDPAATTWQAATTYKPSDNTTTTVVSEKVISGSTTLARPKMVIAPTSAVSAGTCAATPSTKGCRALEFVYATATTATSGVFGDYSGRVKEVRLWSTVPGAGSATSKTVQTYVYDDAGRLRQAWNPQITPSLKTEYAYDTDGRVNQVTEPGKLPWTFTYGKAGNAATAGDGMLLKVARPTLTPGSKTATNGTATTSVVYDVPLTGTNAPYSMGTSDVAAWGQTDVPTDATAVFPADAVPASNNGTSLTAGSYARATISYIDASGRQVNTASPGGHMGAAEFDRFGNVVRELTAGNRELALATSGPALDTLTRLGLNGQSTANRAEQLSTTSVYSTDGQLQTEEFGPLRLVTLGQPLAAGAGGTSLAAGTEIPARKHTVNTYDEGRPTDGSAATSGLITTTRVGAYVDGYPADGDVRTTTTAYDWAKGLETSTSDDPSGLNITKRTTYDASGRVIKTRNPMSTGTDAGTTVTTYWSGTGTGACAGRPEWADLVCSVGPAGNVTNAGANPAELPTTTTEYDWWGNPAKVTRTANGTTSTTTTTYDGAGRVVQVSVTGGGDAVPDTTTTYDSKTGNIASVTASGHTIAHEYDDLGREVTYNDGAGNTTAREYDALDRLTKATDSAPSTITYTYDTAKDPRGLVTSLTDSQAGTISGTYDANGNLESETFPNNYQLSVGRDATEAETARTYTNTVDQTVPLSDVAAYTVHEETANRAHTAGATVPTSFQYDATGRPTRVDTADDTSCTRKTDEYNGDSDLIKQTTYTADCATIDTATGSVQTFAFDSADRPVDAGYTYDAFSRGLTRPDGSSQKYFANGATSQETANGTRKTWELDAENRPASSSDEQQNPDTTWSLIGETVNHYAEEGGEPTWDTSAAGLTRNVYDLDDRIAVTTNNAEGLLQLTDLDGEAAAQIPLPLQTTGASTMSAVGSTSIASFSYQWDGFTLSVPLGCWFTHSINGSGRHINWELAGVDCYALGVFSKFCNTRIDFAYADTNNHTYSTSRGKTHYTCYTGYVPTRSAPGNRYLPHYGKACAKLYINGSRRATQCHYITR
ncbi:DNRLRE domain-containing protein [Streptomyces sp. NPDC059680]|uniref:DNRLRE domain-containing protein n=1 Tax=Streptomyces sp. NPDC059680 TaxID=3346904 RepID=UPI00369C8CDD